MDRGGEYRSLLGLPNGADNPAYPAVEAAATAKGMTLRMGKGNDPDTLGTKSVFVYDTAKFPFYQAEIYHQFRKFFLPLILFLLLSESTLYFILVFIVGIYLFLIFFVFFCSVYLCWKLCMYIYIDNDFQSPAYGKKYNNLQQVAFDDGRLKITNCPDKV